MKEDNVKLNIVDNVSISMGRNKRPFVVEDSILASPDQFKGVVAHVKVTHAGRLTLNNMVYVPSRVREGMQSFISPYEKPIGAHHARDRLQEEDAIGRIKKVAYVKTDLSKQFRSYFADSISVIEDSSRDIHDAVDVIRKIAKNPLFYSKTFPGFGYVLSAGFIPDYQDAKKIADGIYLTASVRAGSNKALCSICDHDWGDSPCEHELGEMVDGVKTFLITDRMTFRGYDYVNEPADELASNVSVTWVNQDTDVSAPVFNSMSNDAIVYELSSSPLVIADSVMSSDNFTDFVRKEKRDGIFDMSIIPSNVKVLSVDAVAGKITVMTSPDDLDGHTHIAVVDIKGNGMTRKGNSPMYDHEHEVKEWQVKEWKDEDENYSSYHWIHRQGPVMLVESSDATGHASISSANANIDNTNTVDNQSNSDKIKGVSDSKNKEVDSMSTENSESKTTKETVDTTKVADNVANEGDRLKEILDSICNDELNVDGLEFSDKDRDLIYDSMSEFLAEDAKLSTEKRKALPDSAFCGPSRSFPANDSAHVTAARQLINRHEGSGSKGKILVSIGRKAKALGCDTEDSVDTKETVDTINLLNDEFVINDTVTDDVLRSSFAKLEQAMVARQLKVDVHSARIETLETEKKELQDSVGNRDEQLKYLRDELRFAYNDSTAVNENAVKSDAQLRQVLVDALNFHNQLTEGKEFQSEDAVGLSTEQLATTYKEKFLTLNANELSAKVNDGTTPIEDSKTIEDPTLATTDEGNVDTKADEPAFAGVEADIYGKAKDIFDSNGITRTVGYLQTLIGNDIISVDFGRKVVNLLDSQKDAS